MIQVFSNLPYKRITVLIFLGVIAIVFAFISRHDIQIETSRDINCSINIDFKTHRFIIKKQSVLHKTIKSWLSQKRWYYPSIVSHYPWLELRQNENTVTIWDDRIILNSPKGQYVSCFFSNQDKAVRKMIVEYFYEQSAEKSNDSSISSPDLN